MKLQHTPKITSTLSQQGIGDFVDIREEVINEDEVTKGKSSLRAICHAIRLFLLLLFITFTLYCASPGKHRLAHKPNSKPKQEYLLDLKEDKEKEEVDEERKTGVLSEEELWARLDDLERQEELQDARYR